MIIRCYKLKIIEGIRFFNDDRISIVIISKLPVSWESMSQLAVHMYCTDEQAVHAQMSKLWTRIWVNCARTGE